MRNTLLPIATLGAVLLAALGAAKSNRDPSEVPSGVGQKPSVALIKRTAAPQSKPKGAADEEDPVRKAGRLAKLEANATLKQSICSFLKVHGEPDKHLVDLQKSGAKPNISYCTYGPSDLAEAVDPVNLPKIDKAVHPKVIIAILPDPVHTQLALRFDESADELQNSLQDLGWIYDRAWLPWDNNSHEDIAAFDGRMETKQAQESYETSPGAIMFRADSALGTTQPLIVLIAGDSPTSGVNTTQFQNAVAIWQQLTGWNNYFNSKDPVNIVAAQDAGKLQILGPTFSGSTPSLKGLLRALTKQVGGVETRDGYFCPSRPLSISIASGTVSDSSHLGQLETSGWCGRNLTIDAKSLNVDLNYEYVHIFAFLEAHQPFPLNGHKSEIKVARLTEAESSYGTTYKFVANDKELYERVKYLLAADEAARLRYKDDVASGNRTATWLDQQEMLSDPVKQYCVNVIGNHPRHVKGEITYSKMEPLHFYFPREISKLRAAYEQNNIFGFNYTSGLIQTQLHLSLSGSAHEDDTIHTFSGDQGAAAMESAMAQLANELDRQRIDVVILSATDVLDEVFVTRYLAQHSPNVSVIMTDVDGLFLRSGDSSMLNAYVLSPWPLLPGNEDWSQPPSTDHSPDAIRALWEKQPWPDPSKGDQRQHDSASGEGLYSATRFLACNPDPSPVENCGAVSNPDKSDAEHPFLRKVALTQYRTPIATWAATTNDLVNDPPLWLSAVGHGGFWPIALVDLDQAKDGLPETMDTNMPRLIKIDFNQDGSEKLLPAPVSRGIREDTSRSITIATGIIALLLALHGIACLRARLDRGFAWSYALSDQLHHHWRRRLQVLITMCAVPALVLLKTRIEAGVAIRGSHYTAFNWAVQIAALLLTIWPLLQLNNAWPGSWPPAMSIVRKRKNLLGFAGAFLVEIAFVVACNWWLWEAITPSSNKWPSERAFVYYRSGHLFCGSAPNLPILLLGGALVLYLVSIFDRLVFFNNRIPRLPNADSALRCPGRKQMRRLNNLLSNQWDKWRLILSGVVVVIVGLFVAGLHEMIPRSLTHGRFDVVIVSMSALVMFLLIFDLAMATAAWTFLRADCLLPLSHSPLRWGFTWIKGWSWKRVLTPGAFSPDRVLEYLRRLDEINRRSMSDPLLNAAFANSRAQWDQPIRDAEWAAQVTQSIGQLNQQIAKTATGKLEWLRRQWGNDYGPITGNDVTERGLRDELALDKYSRESPKDRAAWRASHDRMSQEEFVALLYLGYIRMVLLQIRNRIMTASGMYILLMWALTSYPFLNHHFILVGLTVLLAGLATAVIWIYAQMHRDDILSRTTETATGKLDADFFTKVLSMVGIPLLTLIASQFPEVSNAVFSWLEPGLSSMK